MSIPYLARRAAVLFLPLAVALGAAIAWPSIPSREPERISLEPVRSVRLDMPPLEGAWLSALAVDSASDQVALAWLAGNSLIALEVINLNEASSERLPNPSDRALGLITAIGFERDTVWALDPRNNRLWRYPLSSARPPAYIPIEGPLSSVQVAYSGSVIQRSLRGELQFSVVAREDPPASEPGTGFAVAHFRLDERLHPHLLTTEPLRRVEMFEFERGAGDTVRVALPLSTPTVWAIDPVFSRLLVVEHAESTRINALHPTDGSETLFTVADANVLPDEEWGAARERLRVVIAEAGGDTEPVSDAHLGTPSGVIGLRVLGGHAILVQRTRWSRRVWVDLYCRGRPVLALELNPESGRPYPVRVSLAPSHGALHLAVRGERGESYLESFDLPIDRLGSDHGCGL
jgi:hypothetical protein